VVVLVSSAGEPLDQSVANWAALAAAIGVFLGALIALITIWTGWRASRRERVFRFLERRAASVTSCDNRPAHHGGHR
jgi:uncharacterized membrane protein